ncbi:hypothetical protein HN937_15910, partial [Candidatus Poribacteria bacterium]|nr:hypothetical protein [Candidatus Poribacteria bacterium]
MTDEGTQRKGDATLRFFAPLVDRTWVAEGDGPMGKYTCERRFERVLQRKYVRMTVTWDLGEKTYEETAMFGRDPREKRLEFWSFQSDGKNSHGVCVAADDAPDGAVVFEAQMPAGLARLVMWLTDDRERLR